MIKLNDQRKIWDEIDFKKETVDEWVQFINHILEQDKIELYKPVFGILTVHQIADLVQKCILEIKDELDLIQNGKKEKAKYLFTATEAQMTLNHLKNKIEKTERGLQ